MNEWKPFLYTGSPVTLIDGTTARGPTPLMRRPTGERRFLLWQVFEYRRPTPQEERDFVSVEAW